MFGLSFSHLLILGFVILILNHQKLPELGSAFGKAAKAFRKGLKGKEDNPDKIE